MRVDSESSDMFIRCGTPARNTIDLKPIFKTMKPMIILPPKAMSAADIEILRDNGLCVVVAANPATVKFVDPIPAASNRSHIEDVAIRFSRKILAPGFWSGGDLGGNTRSHLARTFFDLLIIGTPLDTAPSPAEQEKQVFDTAKADELRRLAKEEAKAERAQAKKGEI